jgi:hypothetical protein
MLQRPIIETKDPGAPSRAALQHDPEWEAHPRRNCDSSSRALGAPTSTVHSKQPRLSQSPGGLQRTIGNQAVLCMLSRAAPALQTKVPSTGMNRKPSA